MSAWIWLDGRLVDAHAPHLNVTDRGFQLGDGIFETARARRGVVIELAEHLVRLHESAAALELKLGIDDAALAAGIDALLAAESMAGSGADGTDLGDAALRITISRGSIETRGLLPPGFGDANATIVIQAWPYVPPPDALLRRGVRAIPSAVRRDPRSPLAGVKSTSRADYVYARLEATRAGADDALFLTTDGAISEATTANVWLVSGRTVRTPPPEAAVLVGTTRTWLLRHAAALGLEPVEETIRPDDLWTADEAFLTSSVAGIVPTDLVRRPADRRGTARTVVGGGPDRARGVDRRGQPGRRRMTRIELIGRTRQLIAEGDRLVADPSMPALRTWLQLSDELLSAAWGTMDRYHLAWLMVGKPRSIVRGRPMDRVEEAAYVREVAEQKTAALRMSLDAVERQGMPFVGEDVAAPVSRDPARDTGRG